MYNTNDGIARIDGYVVSVAGAGDMVGQDKRIHIDSVSRTCAYGTVLEEGAPDAEPEEIANQGEEIDVPKRQDWSLNREEHE